MDQWIIVRNRKRYDKWACGWSNRVKSRASRGLLRMNEGGTHVRTEQGFM